MGGLRLRTKFLLSMVAVSATLTFTTLYVVRHTVQRQVRLEIQRDLQNSVIAFRNFQKQRELTLERSASLLADLPNVRALMTTHDAATIQDQSHDLWNLAGSDLLVLADPSGKVMALQATPTEVSASSPRSLFPKLCHERRRAIGGMSRDISTKFFSRTFTSDQPAGNRYWDTWFWVTRLMIGWRGR